MGDEEVGEAVLIVVAVGDSHAGLGDALTAEGCGRFDRHIGELLVALVAEEEIGRRVVGDVEVRVAVLVVVAKKSA